MVHVINIFNQIILFIFKKTILKGTEIHYDRNINKTSNQIELNKARDLVNADTERVIELWNIVFMNYNRINKNKFTKLTNPVIDTGNVKLI